MDVTDLQGRNIDPAFMQNMYILFVNVTSCVEYRGGGREGITNSLYSPREINIDIIWTSITNCTMVNIEVSDSI